MERIRERFEESKKQAIAEEAAREGGTSSETALIRLNGALVKVKAYIDEKFAKRSKSTLAHLSGRSVSNAEGAKRGRAAADAMMMRKGVASGTARTRGALGDGR